VYYRDLVQSQQTDLTDISVSLDSNVDVIEDYQASLGGSNNLAYLEDSYDRASQSAQDYASAVALDSDLEDNKDACIDAAINGFRASRDFAFAPSEVIRITAQEAGVTNISVSYEVDNSVSAGAAEVTLIDDDYLSIKFNGGNPPTINTVVSRIQGAASFLVEVVNLDLSGTSGLIKANLGFPRSYLRGLFIP
jgi:hypothetical protein